MNKKEAKKWFIMGFLTSGEGYNGEYARGNVEEGSIELKNLLENLDQVFSEKWKKEKTTQS